VRGCEIVGVDVDVEAVARCVGLVDSYVGAVSK